MIRRLATLCAAMLCLSPMASAYYHWNFFAQRSGPFLAMPLKFDLQALPDSTVSFFIAQQGPGKLVDGDNFPALVSQIRRAGETWNVAGSALKLRFGGFQDRKFTDVLSEQVTPGIDVVFDDDLPPGVLALSEPQTYTDMAYLGAANSRGFAPIVRGRLQLASDLAARGQASYSDAFFQTLVHEFGHTLGLQHSMTGGAMATSITRGTSKAIPLAADDIAGISVLYPTEQFRKTTGSIGGRVSVARNGANLASVVALGGDGSAIGGMSLPDGSYRIDGLAPGDYLVYAHPLPPAQPGEAEPAGIVSPRDLQRVAFAAAPEFQTRFYPNAKDWHEAVRIHVDAGQVSGGVDFDLQVLTGRGIYNLRMFGYLGAKRDTVVHAPPLPPGFADWLAFQASGTQVTGSAAIVPGLQLSAISDVVTLNQASLRNFPGADQFLLIAGAAGATVRATPVAVAVTVGENLYVLPGALSAVPSKHPLLTGVTAAQADAGKWKATVTGENLSATTRVTFDGADGLDVRLKADGSLEATLPAATGAQRAVVQLLGVDGQTSWQLQGTLPPVTVTYDAPAEPAYAMSPGGVLAGTNVMLQIDGVQTQFLTGKTELGFGTSDIAVRQMWVLAPDKLLVNISVNPKAKLGNVQPTISTGIQAVTLGNLLQVRPADAAQATVQLPVVNDATGLAGAPGGATIALRTSSTTTDIRGWSVVLGGVRSPVSRTDDGRLLVPVASSVPVGPQVLQLVTTSGPQVPPVLFQVDYLPPVIGAVTGLGSLAANPQQRVRAGDKVGLTVTGLIVATPGSTLPGKDDIEVRVAGISQRVDVLQDLGAGSYRVEFMVPADVPAGDTQPVVVVVGTRVSAPVTLAIAALNDVTP